MSNNNKINNNNNKYFYLDFIEIYIKLSNSFSF